jgi:hypothetical protein
MRRVPNRAGILGGIALWKPRTTLRRVAGRRVR